MNRNKVRDINYLLRHFESAVEVAVMTLLYYLMWKFFYRPDSIQNFHGRGKIVLMLVYALLVLFTFTLSECFKFGILRYSDVVLSSCISLILVNFISYLQVCLLSNKMVYFYPILLLTLVEYVIVGTLDYFYTLLYYKMNPPHDMILIFGGVKGLTVKKKIERRDDKYLITESIRLDDIWDEKKELDEVLGIVFDRISAHESVILNDIPADERNAILKYCYEQGIRTYVVPKISDIIMGGSDDINLFDTPIQLVNGTGLSDSERVVKRAVDLILSIITLILVSPIMLIVAIAIKIEDGGPVFFRQERVTRDGRLFSMLKFRSMIENANKEGEVKGTTKEDKRVTKVGNVIRRYRVDELPQLLNIIKGDMSLVGPRPECKEFHEKYCRDIPEFVFRNKVKAGLTGYAQIYGRYNTSAYDKVRLDLIYIEKYSLLLDLKLMLMTLRILLKKESTEGFDDEDSGGK